MTNRSPKTYLIIICMRVVVVYGILRQLYFLVGVLILI